ncbi:MAG TPA: DUF3667 domain-containing protein [Chthoniobacterales bacterium]|nr:DUF3667 domain-containing protein [Chthoniobacterales bacterium]
MSDEPAKIILGDTGIAAIERKSQRGWLRRHKGDDLPPFTHCENCGTQITGHYCSQCGQAAIDYRRSFGHVILDVLNEFLNWDSKFFASIGLLLTRPWRLTNEFVSGKRVRHVHPLRLYLLASVLFFFAVNYGAKGLRFQPGKIAENKRAEVAAAVGEKRSEIEKELDQEKLSPEERRKAQGVLDALTKPVESPSAAPSDSPTSATSPVAPATNSPTESGKRTYGAVGDRPFIVFDENEKTSTPFERWLETRAKEKMGEHGTKMGLFITTLFSNLPYMMLCCIPLFAFVLKVLYVRRRIFYIDHLIYALHIHSFFYAGVMLIVLATLGLNRTIPGTFAGWIMAALWTTFVMQIFLSIRYVYRQGWFISAFKFFTGGLIYLMVLFLALAATFFVTLALPS